MTVLTREHTARKRHSCDRCDGHIKPGQRYQAWAITPNSDLGNKKWLYGQSHLTTGDCYPEEPPSE